MGKNFFKWVHDKINGTSSENINNKPDNGIDRENMLRDAIVSSIKEKYEGLRDVPFKDRSLIIYIVDGFSHEPLLSGTFKESLIITIADEVGVDFGEVEIRPGDPTDSNLIKINDISYYLEIKTSIISKKATISQIDGEGSLISGKCYLDAQQIQDNPGKCYNIGIGEYPLMADNHHRTNHIAIDDNLSSPQYAKNKYVSRSHAHVSYSKDCGFMLHVEISGTRMAEKRTRIIRGARIIDMNSVLIPEPLCDGDIIELSKSVRLLFKYENEDGKK